MSVRRLQSRNDNARLLAAIQCASLYFLLGANDSADRQAADADKRADHGAAQGSVGRGDCLGTQRGTDSQVGQGSDGGVAVSKADAGLCRGGV